MSKLLKKKNLSVSKPQILSREMELELNDLKKENSYLQTYNQNLRANSVLQKNIITNLVKTEQKV